jgi:hypothetical protein
VTRPSDDGTAPGILLRVFAAKAFAYDQLVGGLEPYAKAFAKARPGDDAARLSAALAALKSVILSLGRDFRILEGQLTMPLGYLDQIVTAAASGQRVKVLMPPRADAKGPVASPVPRAVAQGIIAAMVNEAIKSGIERSEAGRKVASLCRGAGVKSEDGNDLTAAQALGFYKACSSQDAPGLACHFYDLVRRDWKDLMPEVTGDARLRMYLSAIGSAYPLAAPVRRAPKTKTARSVKKA